MSAAPRPPSFVNDLETCVGCHACAVACANENGLAPGTSWRQVITHNVARAPALPVFHLSIACNHCLDAPCLRHCPALAISRDARTGAVLIDERACIGCRYCSWVCPYDAPKFDDHAGVMRKCTLCTHRLVEGREPACVSLCPVGALGMRGLTPTFREIRAESATRPTHLRNVEEIATNLDVAPAAPRPPDATQMRGLTPTFCEIRPESTTRPTNLGNVEEITTNFDVARAAPHVAVVAERAIRPMIQFLPMRARASSADATAPVDTGTLPPAELPPAAPPKISLRSEWSLAAFTSVAIAQAGLLLGWMIGGPRVPPALFALAGVAAVALSTAHLGRPWRAWRAAFNLRRSWLSREVVSYSAFVGLGTLALELDPPGGQLAWAATLAATLTLVSIDQVYVAMARRHRSPLDDRTAITGALLVAGLASQQTVLWLPALAIRAATFVLRVRASERPARRLLSGARVALGLVVPLLAWLALPPTAWWVAIASGLAGEALDRLSFYDHLHIVTPRSHLADLEARALAGHSTVDRDCPIP